MLPQSNSINPKIIGNEISFTFQSDAFVVRRVLSDLCDYLATRSVSPDDIENLSISLGEALNNIVEHAYPEPKGGEIHLRCRVKPGTLAITLRDQGKMMPGLTLPKGAAKPDECTFEDMPEGGFGWFMIRALSQKIDYQRINGTNRLHFVLPLQVKQRATA